MFSESVFVLKNFRKSKNFTTLFLVTHSQVMLVASLLRSFCNSLVSESPSREKHLENFSKFLGFGHFCDYIASGSSSRELTQKLSWFTRKWISQSRKRLSKNFQNFVQGILATRLGYLLMSHWSHEKCVFCKRRVKNQTNFQNFSFSFTSRVSFDDLLWMLAPYGKKNMY